MYNLSLYAREEKNMKLKNLSAFILAGVMALSGVSQCFADSNTAAGSSGGSGTGSSGSAASGSAGAAASDPAVTLVMAEVNPLDSIIGQMDSAFKEKVEELSGGSITVDIQASGVLGAEENVLDSIAWQSGQYTIRVPGVDKLNLCTLYDSMSQFPRSSDLFYPGSGGALFLTPEN